MEVIRYINNQRLIPNIPSHYIVESDVILETIAQVNKRRQEIYSPPIYDNRHSGEKVVVN